MQYCKVRKKRRINVCDLCISSQFYLFRFFSFTYTGQTTCKSQCHLMFYISHLFNYTPPPRYPSGIVLASSAGGPGFNHQSRTASYQRRYKNGTSSALFSTEHSKGKILALSQESRIKLGK